MYCGVCVMCAWCLCGVFDVCVVCLLCVVCAWCVCGVSVVCMWCKRGVCVVCAWCVWCVRGVCCVCVVCVWCLCVCVASYATRMRRIILLSVSCTSLPHFPTLSHKQNGSQ